MIPRSPTFMSVSSPLSRALLTSKISMLAAPSSPAVKHVILRQSAALQPRTVTQKRPLLRLSYSSSTKRSSSQESENVLMSGTISKSMGEIVRHGRGDACIVLNVGGTEFITLRSTVAGNPVLADYVARAEANQELIAGIAGKRGSVFIDRDPKNFGFILQYLRNHVVLKTSGLPSNTPIPIAFDAAATTTDRFSRMIGSWKTQSCMPGLPKDPKTLGEIYVEATYYRLEDLQNALQDQSTWTKLVGLLGLSKVGGVSGNPFVRASQVLATAKVAMVTFGSCLFAGILTVTQGTGLAHFGEKIQNFGMAAAAIGDQSKEKDKDKHDNVQVKALPSGE